jgi:hypothetical protein
MTGPLITGQHITYIVWGFTALSVAWHLFNRGRPHDAVCQCQWCVKQEEQEKAEEGR